MTARSSLADLQEGLAALLVDGELREALAAGRGAEGFRALGLELDASTLACLAQIDAAALARAAAGLARKRRRSLEATAPHSARLWPALGAHYLKLRARCPARVEDLDRALGPGPSELRRWLPQLRAAVADEPLAPPWTADLLALELARACSRRDGRTRRLLVDYPVPRALDALDAGWLSVDLEPQRCELLVDADRLRWRPLPEPAHG